MSAAKEIEGATVLAVGARGKHGGAAFTLAGRTCARSDAGGLWNEWSLVFDDGRRWFLSEAAAGFTLFVDRPLVPAYDALVVGGPLLPGFVVVERGQARRVASWGDVPEAPKTYRYADLSATAPDARGQSATIDYGDPAAKRGEIGVFLGRKTSLAELGLTPRPDRPRFLPAPSGPLPKGLELWLAVGDDGELATDDGTARFRVIGIVQRSIKIEGERFTWEEYVLFSARAGLRWLVVSDGHWSLVTTVEPGAVESSERGARLDGVLFKEWSSGTARLEWATGELPWAASVGDAVSVRDYVHAPDVLSFESTRDELTWSRGTYTPPDVVGRAFGKRLLPKPIGRAPNQPRTPKRR